MYGNSCHKGPYYLDATFVDVEHPVQGFSNAMVLRSGTMLHFAKTLQEIGRNYYGSYGGNPQYALDLTHRIRNEVLNARERLDYSGFEDEIHMLDNYLNIFSGELAKTELDRMRIVEDVEILPPVRERSLHDHMENLYREMTLDLSAKKTGTIAVSGFSMKDGHTSELTALLDEMAMVEIAKLQTLTVIERGKMDVILQEQALSLSDLMDTGKAIDVGRLLTADHMLTGTVIEMPNSVVIFGRIINVETAEIESAAQVIVSKNREVAALL
jgi:TolB-like protein